MASPLRTIYWNANGLIHKKTLLRALLEEQDIDVVLLCETLLTPTKKLHMPGYHTYRLDNPPDGATSIRGLAVMVRRKLVHQVLPTPQLLTMQAIGIELLIANRPHRLYSIYRPHGTLDIAEVHKLLDSDTPTALAGDWNAKNPAWNSSTVCSTGKRLLHDSEQQGYNICGPEVPTHYPFRDNHLPDVLDLVVTRRLHHPPSLEVLTDAMGSDHLPVLAIYYPNSDRVPLPALRKRVNWEKFTELARSRTTSRPTTSALDVEELANSWTTEVCEALEEATERLPDTLTKPPLPLKLRNLIEKKRKIRRQWQSSRCPTQKTLLNRLACRVQDGLDEKYSDQWDRTIEAATEDQTSLHRLCRSFTRSPDPIRPLLHPDGNLRYRAADRAEILAEHLEAQFQPFPSQNVAHTREIEERLARYLPNLSPAEEEPLFFSPDMVKRTIVKLKPRKAPGADGITNTALKRLPQNTLAAMTRLYNGILRTGHFPSRWKMGIVIMIPKPGKNTLRPESYRPITLLPTISKVFEILLLQKINPHLTPRPEQFGFRAEHSTTQQLARVLHILTAAANKKEKAVAVFLDMEKAFDRVWHPGLLHKLSETTTPQKIVKVVTSFLTERTFRVRVDTELSEERPIAAGVPQGSCLSPVLYTLYTNDIPCPKDVTLALYADDAAYVATSLRHEHAADKLQRALDELPEWLGKWRMSANPAKTQAICLGPQHRTLPPRLTLLGEEVDWSTTVTYLGLTIDRNLNMKAHIRKISAHTRAATYALSPILKSRLPLRTKIGVYKTYIRPRLTYAAPAWYALASEPNRKTLRQQQTSALRRIVNAPRYVRNSTIQRDLRIESIDNFIHTLTKNVFARAETSQHPQLQDLAPWHARPPDRRAYPRDLLKSDR